MVVRSNKERAPSKQTKRRKIEEVDEKIVAQRLSDWIIRKGK